MIETPSCLTRESACLARFWSPPEASTGSSEISGPDPIWGPNTPSLHSDYLYKIGKEETNSAGKVEPEEAEDDGPVTSARTHLIFRPPVTVNCHAAQLSTNGWEKTTIRALLFACKCLKHSCHDKGLVAYMCAFPYFC